jgi:hypothetical protein
MKIESKTNHEKYYNGTKEFVRSKNSFFIVCDVLSICSLKQSTQKQETSTIGNILWYNYLTQ